MRSLFICALSAALFLNACKSKDNTTVTSDDSKTTVTSENNQTSASVDAKNVQDAASEMEKKTAELKKLTPLTIDQIKAMLPEELLGMKRSNFSANAMMGFGSGEAQYKKDDTTNIKLTIFDCAGEAGSGYYALNYWTKMSMETQNDQGYTKTIDFMGGKALEDYKNYNNARSLSFGANDRLFVTLQGQNVGLDMLKDAVKALNLKVN